MNGFHAIGGFSDNLEVSPLSEALSDNPPKWLVIFYQKNPRRSHLPRMLFDGTTHKQSSEQQVESDQRTP
jgi:hypothetical protein